MFDQVIALRSTFRSSSWLRSFVLAGGASFALAASGAEPMVLEVSAGKYDRRDTPVCCPLTQAVESWPGFSLIDAETRRPITGQLDHGSKPPRLWWVLAAPLKARQSRRYLLTQRTSSEETLPLVQVLGDGRSLSVEIDHRPVLQYNSEKVPSDDPSEPAFHRSGFIHPLYDPAGGVVSDGMPPDHMHQHALMCAWVNTTFEGRNVDFWNSAKHQAEVRHAHVKDRRSGTVFGSFTTTLEHVDLTAPGGPKTALLETWLVRVYAHAGGYLLDIESSQNCACESPLIINKYHYGGMAFRGARDWFGDKPGEFLTSEGKGRKDGNHTRPNWVEMFGKLADHESGVAVFCHPDNFRAPQPVRLHPDKPYFCFAPMVLGDFTIQPGKPYVSTYRYFIHTGKPDPQANDALWNDFAEPPIAKILAE